MTGARQRRDGALAFIQHEATGGLLLVGAAIAALLVANSPLQGLYRSFPSAPIGLSLSGIELEKPVLLWINAGLMAIFFFLVGLEIKRELIVGELSSLGTKPPCPASPPRAAWQCRRSFTSQSMRVIGSPCGVGPFRRPPTLPLRSACWHCSATGCPPRSRSSCWRSPSSMIWAALSSSPCSLRAICTGARSWPLLARRACLPS
jgi:Na+/H+ antiporter 1